MPGNAYLAERFDPQKSGGYIDRLTESAGLNQPWHRQYSSWVASCIRGECGRSLTYGIPVAKLLGPRIRRTLQIAVPGLACSWLLGLGLAMAVVSFGRGSGSTVFDPAVASAGLVPDVIAAGLLLWGAVKLGLPIQGAWLPVLGLTISLTPVIYLHASSSLATARDLPFVRLACRRGIEGQQLWLRYVLAAAASPLISLAGLSLAAAIGSSLLVEVLMGWPGLGPMFLEALQSRDYSVVQTVIVLLAAILAASNFVADLVMYFVDPRIRIAR